MAGDGVNLNNSQIQNAFKCSLNEAYLHPRTPAYGHIYAEEVIADILREPPLYCVNTPDFCTVT